MEAQDVNFLNIFGALYFGVSGIGVCMYVCESCVCKGDMARND